MLDNISHWLARFKHFSRVPDTLDNVMGRASRSNTLLNSHVNKVVTRHVWYGLQGLCRHSCVDRSSLIGPFASISDQRKYFRRHGDL